MRRPGVLHPPNMLSPAEKLSVGFTEPEVKSEREPSRGGGKVNCAEAHDGKARARNARDASEVGSEWKRIVTASSSCEFGARCGRLEFRGAERVGHNVISTRAKRSYANLEMTSCGSDASRTDLKQAHLVQLCRSMPCVSCREVYHDLMMINRPQECLGRTLRCANAGEPHQASAINMLNHTCLRSEHHTFFPRQM